METQIFHHAKIKIKKSSKNHLKETKKILQDIITLQTYLTFQQNPKFHLFKNPHIKTDRVLPRGGPKSINPLLYAIMNLNTISFFALVGKANKKNS